MIKGIIWDMDGVLIDSEKHHVNAEIATMREFGIPLTQEIADKYRGASLKSYVGELAKQFKVKVAPELVIERHQGILDEYYAHLFPLVPHVKTVLSELSEGYSMAIGTSALRRNAMSVVDKYHLGDFFGAVVTASDVKHTKPDPAIFLLAGEKLEVEPSKIVVVEDSINGFLAAKAAGMKVIGRRAIHNKYQDFSSADLVIEDLLEVKEAISKL